MKIEDSDLTKGPDHLAKSDDQLLDMGGGGTGNGGNDNTGGNGDGDDEDDARARSLQLGGGGLKLGGAGKYTKFLGDVREELRKVTWPTRKMVVTETIVVLVVLVFFTLLITGLDQVYSFGFNKFLFNQ